MGEGDLDDLDELHREGGERVHHKPRAQVVGGDHRVVHYPVGSREVRRVEVHAEVCAEGERHAELEPPDEADRVGVQPDAERHHHARVHDQDEDEKVPRLLARMHREPHAVRVGQVPLVLGDVGGSAALGEALLGIRLGRAARRPARPHAPRHLAERRAWRHAVALVAAADPAAELADAELSALQHMDALDEVLTAPSQRAPAEDGEVSQDRRERLPQVQSRERHVRGRTRALLASLLGTREHLKVVQAHTSQLTGETLILRARGRQQCLLLRGGRLCPADLLADGEEVSRGAEGLHPLHGLPAANPGRLLRLLHQPRL